MTRTERIEWVKRESIQRNKSLTVIHPEGSYAEAFTFEQGKLTEYALKELPKDRPAAAVATGPMKWRAA